MRIDIASLFGSSSFSITQDEMNVVSDNNKRIASRRRLVDRHPSNSFYLPGPKALFLHIPRTGGTWFKRALLECDIPRITRLNAASSFPRFGRKHLPLICHRRTLLRRAFCVFTFVRHPVAWYESYWRMCRAGYEQNFNRRGKSAWWDHTIASDTQFDFNFEVWLRTLLKESPCCYTRLLERYVGPEGQEWVDWIGRTETMTEDFCELMELFGYEKYVHRQDLDRLPRNSTNGIIPEWTDSMRELVEHEERVIIRRFYGEDVDKRVYHKPLQR